MDRNYIIKITVTAPRVALRKESVDRNMTLRLVILTLSTSLSARRAWIEITQRRDFKALGLRRSPQGERG